MALGRRVILDTSILIASEKKELDLISVIGPDDPALAAITVMKLLVGVESWTSERRDERVLKIEGYFASLPIEAYTPSVARIHALLYQHACKIGQPRSAHDLIIPATAAATGRTLLTADKTGKFGELPAVTVEVVTAR